MADISRQTKKHVHMDTHTAVTNKLQTCTFSAYPGGHLVSAIWLSVQEKNVQMTTSEFTWVEEWSNPGHTGQGMSGRWKGCCV